MNKEKKYREECILKKRRVCTCCKEEKPFKEFSKKTDTLWPVQGVCKTCAKKKFNKRYKHTPGFKDSVKKAARNYILRHPKRIVELNAKNAKLQISLLKPCYVRQLINDQAKNKHLVSKKIKVEIPIHLIELKRQSIRLFRLLH
jgi:hypothetical protein